MFWTHIEHIYDIISFLSNTSFIFYNKNGFTYRYTRQFSNTKWEFTIQKELSCIDIHTFITKIAIFDQKRTIFEHFTHIRSRILKYLTKRTKFTRKQQIILIFTRNRRFQLNYCTYLLIGHLN